MHHITYLPLFISITTSMRLFSFKVISLFEIAFLYLKIVVIAIWYLLFFIRSSMAITFSCVLNTSLFPSYIASSTCLSSHPSILFSFHSWINGLSFRSLVFTKNCCHYHLLPALLHHICLGYYAFSSVLNISLSPFYITSPSSLSSFPLQLQRNYSILKSLLRPKFHFLNILICSHRNFSFPERYSTIPFVSYLYYLTFSPLSFV